MSDPKIPVTVESRSGAISIRFLIDTGADFSLAPHRLGQQAGLDWDALREARVIGVEQGGLTARLGHLPIQLGSTRLAIRCLCVDSPRAPFILGRADFLDRFVLTIDQARARIVLTEISR